MVETICLNLFALDLEKSAVARRIGVVFLLLVLIAVGSMLGLAVGVVGLLEAPWPVLLVLLGIAFYGLQRLDTPPDASIDTPSNGQAPGPSPLASEDTIPNGAVPNNATPSPLTYRGVAYQSRQETLAIEDPASPSAPSPDGPPPQGKLIEGMYRGQKWQRVVDNDDAPPSSL